LDIKAHARLLWRWSWAIVLMALLSGASVWYMTRWIPRTYTSSARILVYQAPASSGTSDYTEILTSNRMVRSYAQMLQARPLLEAVIHNLDLDMSPAILAQALTVDIIRETQVMVLTIETEDPQQAAEIANELAALFIDQHYELTASLYSESRQELEARMSDIEEDIEDTQDRLNRLGKVRTFQEQAEYDRLQMLLWQHRSEYSQAFHSLENVMMAEAQSTDLLHIIEPAIPAQQPAQPRTGLFTLLAAMGGAFLAAGLVTVRDYLADRVRTASQVEHLTEQPVLAAVPRRRIFRGPARGPLADEAYDTLAARLTLLSTSPPRTLLLTSSNPREGTSTMALNLARTLAQRGQRVVLVDAALRKPVLHRWLDVQHQPGLSTVLESGLDQLDSALFATAVDNLWLLPAGSESLALARLSDPLIFALLLEELKTRADMVLIDSVALLPVVDTLLLADHTDAALLVVRSDVTTRQALRQAHQRLQQADTRLIGSVLTGSSAVSREASRAVRYYHCPPQQLPTEAIRQHTPTDEHQPARQY
jgi:capsular exopolysaccharide synthesis family protein